ncbi:hypothetical protein SLEP1_g47061 [Rubroshorea leprosula]|uniref:Large ribosomal RNA subunit accumulation protein YCED homolog 1, chloroplastic n=1 Tax=Rubroshorea leprosula TaxID=152421 RepID=A0AAV5LQ10_9ROSI|nr:hypothetical protein SLEP1_g47061 [Rubroshorea leprosula]
MSLVTSASFLAPSSPLNLFKEYNSRFHRNALSIPLVSIPCKFPCCVTQDDHKTLRNKTHSILARDSINFNSQSVTEENALTFDWEDEEDVEDTGSPWEGAIIYKRNPSITHVEYCTTLERLGLGKLSTEVSKSRASVMGLRVTKAVKEYPDGTPVQVSIDITKKEQLLRLDGIIKTVITLGCNRCGEPAAESIFSNFSLLLSEEPVEEPEIIDIGAIFGKEKFISSGSNEEEEEGEDDDWLIDWDDRLYFPPEEKEIDISKHIRDLVHLEITITAVCDPMCKGLCLTCGTNLNTSTCNCGKEAKEKGHGSLRSLKKQMQKKKMM